MANTFCTIITAGYYPFALALYKSLKKYDPDVLLQVLITDEDSIERLNEGSAGPNIVPIKSIRNYWLVDSLYDKYASENMDFFRWSLKPVLIKYLLENGFEKVLYTDCDIFFFNDFKFLWDELNDSRFLLSPHWFTADPRIDKTSFILLFTRGIYNGGFIGANKNAEPILQWWADACYLKTGPTENYGFFDDQRYLDIIPVKFENVRILKHKGCNLIAGTHEECKRTLTDKVVLINGQYPLVCIHFSKTMISEILKGHDPLLRPYFKTFKNVLEEGGIPLRNFIGELDKLINPNFITRIKWKLQVRTLLKKSLHKLSQRFLFLNSL